MSKEHSDAFREEMHRQRQGIKEYLKDEKFKRKLSKIKERGERQVLKIKERAELRETKRKLFRMK